MRRSTAVLLPLLSLLAACSAGESRPNDWGAVRLADDGACPQLIGRYLVDDSPVAWSLALRFVSLDDDDREPESFAVADQTDSSMLMRVRYTDGTDETHTLRRGSEYGGDYLCDDGWVVLANREVSSRWDDQFPPRGGAPKRRSLRLAPAVDGAIVARLDGVWFEGFQPYAPGSGDGIPLPWTWKQAHVWSRTEPYSDAALARRRRLGTPSERTRRAELARARQDPVYLEEQALDNPPSPPSHAIARRRIQREAHNGLRVVAVTPRDSGWHVSVAARDDDVVTQFVSRLAQQSDVLEARHEPIYRGVDGEGLMTTVVFVRLTMVP